VTWRWSNIYIGWAPLPPDIAFMMRINALPYSLPHYYWVFVEGRYFWNPYLYRYTLPYERNVTIINYTTIRTNIYVENLRVINRGIDTDVVRRVTKRELTKRQLKDLNKPEISRVEAREAEIFRPTIKKNKAAKPKKVLSKEEAKVKISRGTIRKSVDDESRLKEEHEKEINLLEKSQEKEVEELRKKIEDEKKITKEPSEKEKVVSKKEEEISKLKKRHEEEKSEIKKRHKEEEVKVKKKEDEEKETKKKKIKKKKK